MPRPPKRINPQAHKTVNHSTEDGRAFKKGRFAATAGEPAGAHVLEAEATVVDVGHEDTATLNAAFANPPVRSAGSEAPLPPNVRKSKYDARPTTAGGPGREVTAPEEVTVDITDDDERAGLALIDLTKLPPVDPDGGSDTSYIRHSDGWPTSTD